MEICPRVQLVVLDGYVGGASVLLAWPLHLEPCMDRKEHKRGDKAGRQVRPSIGTDWSARTKLGELVTTRLATLHM